MKLKLMLVFSSDNYTGLQIIKQYITSLFIVSAKCHRARYTDGWHDKMNMNYELIKRVEQKPYHKYRVNN